MGEPKLDANQIGNYRIEEQIGRGGMGVVYRGRHLKLPREVAIKIVKAASSDDLRRHRERFEREAFIQSQLDHPGIVKVYDYIVNEATYFIVMEYVEGSSLAEVLAESPRGIAPGRALDIFQNILAGVSYAHNFTYQDEAGDPHTGIIHRDLKPANILVTPDDRTKITDFGIVKLVGVEHTETFSRPYGTPQYVSPEQAEGRELDQRSDIYSLGIILYELLTGTPPFGGRPDRAEVDGESGPAGVGTPADQPLRRSEILIAHIQRAPRPPSELNPAITTELEGAVLRALAKKPDDRFSSVVEFARAVNRATRNGGYAQASSASNATASLATSSSPAGAISRRVSRLMQRTEHLASPDDKTIEFGHTARTTYVTQPIGDTICASCGADAEPGDRKCLACGHNLNASPATSTLAVKQRSKWQYISGASNVTGKWRRSALASLTVIVGCLVAYGIFAMFSLRATQKNTDAERLEASKAVNEQQAREQANRSANLSASAANIVRVMPSSVRVDSSFSGYNAEPLTDGIIDTKRIAAMRYNRGNWASAELPEPHWIELEFAAPVRLATVYLYWGFDRSRYMASNKVELLTAVEGSERWRSVATIEPGEDYDRTAFTFEPFETKRIRIMQPAQMGPRNRPFVMWMREIVAFAAAPAATTDDSINNQRDPARVNPAQN